MKPLAVGIEVAIQILFPILIAIFIVKKYQAPWKAFVVGLVFFVLSQLMESPFRAAVGAAFSAKAFNIYGMLFLMSLIAAFGEEIARYIAFRFIPLFKREVSWRTAILYGIGHGGMESFLVAISILTLTLLFYFASPKFLAQLPKEIIVSFKKTSAYLFLLGGAERVMTVIIQMGLSLIVALTFIRNNIRFLFIAIGLHFAIDFSGLMVLNLSKNPFITEGVILLFSLALLWWIIWFKNSLKGESTSPGE